MTVRILVGDALTRLRSLPDGSVNTVVTSPPYWGLRDYGTARWEGGDPTCAHRGRLKPQRDIVGKDAKGSGAFGATRGTESQKAIHAVPVRNRCRCGALRIDSQIGLERTPEEYVARMVEVFREVRRVLMNDGTLWLNVGDSYATGAGGVGEHPGGGKQGDRWAGRDDSKGRGRPRVPASLAHSTDDLHYVGPMTQPNRMPIPGLKSKDLVGIPWMLAFALRSDGWYLRADIIWQKPNPMPESVRDRPTKAHEYVFLLTKSRRYYYDADAIMEPLSPGSIARLSQANLANQRGSDRAHAGGKTNGTMKPVVRKSGSKERKQRAEYGGPESSTKRQAHSVPWEGSKRNRRSVWTVTTRPFKGAHFATFPPQLIEPCVLAGSPIGGVVLDPFGGAGTTGLVADEHGRDAVLIELNPAYAELTRKRVKDVRGVDAEVIASELPAPVIALAPAPLPPVVLDLFAEVAETVLTDRAEDDTLAPSLNPDKRAR